MALTRIDTDQLEDGAVTNAKISASAAIAGSKLEDNLTYGSNLTISGNLTVNGTTTTVDTTNMIVEDPLLVFSANASGSAAVDAGFVVERGDDTNVGFIWDESADQFVAITTTETGSTAGNVTVSAYADIQVNDITANDIAGTLTTATQNNVTTMTSLATTGTITTGTWEATDVGVSHGGTGASNASDARTNLGVAIGSDVQAYDAALDDISGLAVTDGNIIVGDGTNWVAESGATARASLGLTIGTDVQAYDAELAAIAGLTSAADKGIQFTGSGTAATYDLTAAGKALLDDANAAAQLVTLGLTATAAELNTLDDITSTTAELNIVDGDTAATSTTLADADRVVVNDGGTMVQVALTDFETYFETALDTLNNVTSASSLATVGTITSGTWQGTAVADTYVANDLTIDGGDIDNTAIDASVIGGATPAAGTFTTLTANDQLVVAAGATITGDTTDEITLAVKGVGSQTANLMTVEISDGTDKFTIAADGSVVIAEDLTLASGATVSAILDEDNMASDSATALATQQSIKAYVDAQVGSVVLAIAGDSGTDNVSTNGDTLTFTGGTNITSAVTDNEVTVNLDADVSGLTSLVVDDLTIDGSSITNSSGNITLSANSGAGDVIISGDLTVNGTTTTVNSTVTTLDDPIFTLGGDSAPASDDNKDRGIEFRWHDGATAKVGFFGYDDSSSKFTFVPDATNSSEVISGTAGNVIFGNIEGTITTATQNSITTMTGLTTTGTIGTGVWEATDVGVAHGGTGASNAADARTNLGVAIGSDVQAYDAALDDISGLAVTDGNIIVGDGTNWVAESGATARASLGLTIGTDVQAYDAELAALAGLTSAADALPYFTGSGTAGVTTLTSFARSILDDADEATFKATVNLEIGTDVQAYDAELAAIAGLTSAADKGIQFTGSGTAATYDLTAAGKALLDDADAAAQRTTLGLVIGTDVQAWDAQLDDIAALAVTDGNFIVGDGTNWVVESGDTAIASLGVTATGAELNVLDGITSSTAELNIVDGDTTATSTTLADADRLVVNDDGTMVQVALTDLETYFETALDTLNNVTSASSLATVGTITSGTWNGSVIGVEYGGTGAATLASNSLLTGNGTSAVQAEANITYDGTTFGVDDAAVFNESAGDNDFRIESVNNANMFYVDASVDSIGLLTATPNAGTVLDMSASTESFLLPKGTAVQRPGSAVAGMFRYNTDDNVFEFYNGTSWKQATTEFTLIQSETFTGDGSTTAFTGLNANLTTNGCIVTVNGVVQIPTSAYAISGTTITFTEAPANGDAIEIRELTTTTSVNALEDADGDTKIQVEESSDEDVIRFDVAGTEVAYMNGTGLILNTGTFQGKATSAQYADLAERYTSDAIYEPGTVVSFGGDAEVTMATESMDSRIAGVVSTNPGFLMNEGLEGTNVAVALTGRVPVKVTGTIRKGDMLVSAGEGYAKAEANPRLGSVIGKALEDFNGVSGIIEVVVGRL